MIYNIDAVANSFSKIMSLNSEEHLKIADEIFSKQPIILQAFLALTADKELKEPYLSSVFKLMPFIWENIKNSTKIDRKITDDEFEKYSNNTNSMLKYLEHEDEPNVEKEIYNVELLKDSRKWVLTVVYSEVLNSQAGKEIDLYIKAKVFFYLLALVNCVSDLL
jgi:hypothetical protein